MSMSKLNRSALEELYVYWFYKANGRAPEASPHRSRVAIIKLIWMLKRVIKKEENQK
jgi:hypothetical protein